MSCSELGNFGRAGALPCVRGCTLGRGRGWWRRRASCRSSPCLRGDVEGCGEGWKARKGKRVTTPPPTWRAGITVVAGARVHRLQPLSHLWLQPMLHMVTATLVAGGGVQGARGPPRLDAERRYLRPPVRGSKGGVRRVYGVCEGSVRVCEEGAGKGAAACFRQLARSSGAVSRA